MRTLSQYSTLLYRDMFLHMFIVLLTHSDNSEIINLAWGISMIIT